MDRELPVSVWPEWKIIEKIGEGSFGKVYKAERTEQGKTFYSAIKVITIPSSQSELNSVRSECADEKSARDYFQNLVEECIQEVSTMEYFRGNSYVVSVEDYKVVEYLDTIGWDIFIRMEYLTSFLEYCTGKQLQETEVIQLGIDLCKALEYCQKQNIIHRDIKPENIFVSRFGEFKLGDFGIARELEKSMSGFSKKGTFSYMAPEMYRGESYDSRVDIYSLGIVLYKLMNKNRLPFLNLQKQLITYRDKENALTRRMSGEQLPDPGDAGEDFAGVILKACAYDKEERYQTAEAFKEALEEVQYRRRYFEKYGKKQERASGQARQNAAGSGAEQATSSEGRYTVPRNQSFVQDKGAARQGRADESGQSRRTQSLESGNRGARQERADESGQSPRTQSTVSGNRGAGQERAGQSGQSPRTQSTVAGNRGARQERAGQSGQSPRTQSLESGNRGTGQERASELGQPPRTKSSTPGNRGTGQVRTGESGQPPRTQSSVPGNREAVRKQTAGSAQTQSGTDSRTDVRTAANPAGRTKRKLLAQSGMGEQARRELREAQKTVPSGNRSTSQKAKGNGRLLPLIIAVIIMALAVGAVSVVFVRLLLTPAGQEEGVRNGDVSENPQVAKAFEKIQEQATEIVNNLSSYNWIGSEQQGRINYLDDKGEVMKILIYPSKSAEGYYEEYYYWEGELFFAYIWADQNTLPYLEEGQQKVNLYYYEDGELIRWIDEGNVCHDLQTDDEEYVNRGKKYWNQAVEYASQLNAEETEG